VGYLREKEEALQSTVFTAMTAKISISWDVFPSKISEGIYRTTWYHMPEDNTLLSQRSQ
jgi:hypothetical protein